MSTLSPRLKNSTTIIKKSGRIVLYGLTALQLVLAVMWLIRNFTVIPDFALSADYLESAHTLVRDEFMSLYYSRLLALIYALTKSDAVTAIITYVLQVIIVSMASYKLSKVITDSKYNKAAITLFIVTNPLVLEAECSILPYAFRLAITIYVVVTLLRAGTARKLVTVFVIVALMFLSDITATPLSYQRAERNMVNYAMQRLSWPNIGRTNYTYFLEQTGLDTTDVFGICMAPEFLWTDFIPLLDKTYSENDFSKEVKKAFAIDHGLKEFKRSTITSWAADITSYIFAPFTVSFNLKGVGYSRTGIVYGKFVHKGGAAPIYFAFGEASALVLTIFGIVIRIFHRISTGTKTKNKADRRFVLYIGASVLFTALYFSVFALRGFDPLNTLWTVVIWPVAAIKTALQEPLKKEYIE